MNVMVAAVALVALLALIASVALIGPRRLSVAQFAMLYVTRFRAGIGGIRLLPEHVIAVIMLVSAVITGRLDQWLKR